MILNTSTDVSKGIAVMTLENIYKDVGLSIDEIIDAKDTENNVIVDLTLTGKKKVSKYYANRVMICLLFFAVLVLSGYLGSQPEVANLSSLPQSQRSDVLLGKVSYVDLCFRDIDGCLKLPGTSKPIKIPAWHDNYRELQRNHMFAPFMALKLSQIPGVCFGSAVELKSGDYKEAVLTRSAEAIFTDVRRCEAVGAKLIIFPLGLRSRQGGFAHANLLIYNTTSSVLERFDPNGAMSYEDDNFSDLRRFDTHLTEVSQKNGITYDMHRAFPIQNYENKAGKLVNSGMCEAWVYWYLNLRLANPTWDVTSLNRVLYNLDGYGVTLLMVNFAVESMEQFEELFVRIPKIPSLIRASRPSVSPDGGPDDDDDDVWQGRRGVSLVNPVTLLLKLRLREMANIWTEFLGFDYESGESLQHIPAQNSSRYSSYWKQFTKVLPPDHAMAGGVSTPFRRHR